MDVLKGFSEWFWNPNIWLMPGVSWQDVESTPENGYPNPADLLPCTIALAVFFLILRYVVVEPLIVKPFGRAIGLKEHLCKKPPYSRELESLFMSNRNCKMAQNQVQRVAEAVGWTERQVERWLRQRRVAEKSSKIFKLCDCCWQLFYYVCYCGYGVYVLHDKFWFWDIRLCWTNFPFQAVTNDIWWYYMIPLGYYTIMSLTFMIQHQRKDSLQMLIHHLVTIALIVLSFVVNMIRAGSLILFVHECADIPLQLAKISGYAGYSSSMDFLFVIFLFLWIATRLFLFPFWIMKDTLFEAHVILDTMYPIYYIFNGLLFVLLTFHSVWTYFIIQIIVKKFKTKQIKDVRSDSEVSEDFGDESSLPTTEANHVKKEN